MRKISIFSLFVLISLGFAPLAFSNPQLNLDNTANPLPASNIQILESLENAFISISARSKPAVVSITAHRAMRKEIHFWPSSPGFDQRDATGFIFRKDGYILTNDHVVNGAKRIIVRLFDDQEFKAQLIGTDASTDIAVLKIDTTEELVPLSFADSGKVKVGQLVIAIGNPFQLDYTVTTGIVSGKGRSLLPDADSLIRYQDFIQTDAWINRGNSGGPLLNIYGEVIGINSMIRRPDDAPATDAVRAGAGFAIPINLVKKISDQLITNGKVIRGWLGIYMRKHPKGIRVSGFPANTSSPAKRGGIETDDVIIEYNGQKVVDTRQLKFLIADSLVGEEVHLTVLNRGKRKNRTVTIGEMPLKYTGKPIEPNSESWKKLGLAVRDLRKRDSERYIYLNPDDQGVIVEKVQPGAFAPKAGIPRGALISAINGQKIRNTDEYEKILKQALEALEITFEIKTSYKEDKDVITVKLSPQ